MRVGIGYHACRVGTGHSHLDAACEALRAALLGAAGLGSESEDAGRPQNATEHARIDALSAAIRRIERENYMVVNVDIVLGDEGGAADASASVRPLREQLARALHVSPGAVSVRRVGPTGIPWSGEGAAPAALAVALVDQMADIDVLHAAMRSSG